MMILRLPDPSASTGLADLAKTQPEKPKITTDHPQDNMLCPRCGTAVMDYNGLLQLVCPQCGVLETGAST
jgi:ribosomal protein S27AE